jgi:hypothetical protein
VVSVIDRNQRHELLLVDAASGRVRWRRGLPGPLHLDMNPAVDRLALVTGSDVVLVTPGPRGEPPTFLPAYRAGDGRRRWRIPSRLTAGPLGRRTADYWSTAPRRTPPPPTSS